MPPAVTPRLLDVRNLNVSYGTHRAVTALDLHIEAGEVLALVGESGCGKSTTAMALLRLLPPVARVHGEVHFDGVDLLALSESRLSAIRGHRISMIFQEPTTSLNPVLKIGDQIGEALRLHLGMSRRAARARTLELLDLVQIAEPARRIDDYPHQFSGGQRQRVMIAAAIACEPKLLVADEPTTALDVTIQADILALLDRLRRDLSMGLLLITHDLGVVADWADRVVVMYRGREMEQQTTRAFTAKPRHAYSRGLLGASLHLGADRHYRTSRLAEVRVKETPKGELAFSLETPPAKPENQVSSADATPMLVVDHVNTIYQTAEGPRHAVRDVSLTVNRAETVGLVGESGCGKTSLSRTIMRLVDSASGRILLNGQDISSLSRKALLPHRRHLQMIFQDPFASLNPRQTVDQILQFALTVQGGLSKSERRARINHILDAVGLPADARHRYPHEFSGGQRQRIGIARALVLKPAMLICDEPVSALDVSIQAQILNLLVDLKAEFNLSMLFISHDLAVVRYIADRVLVMHAGRIVESGDHDAIWSRPAHAYTRSLIASAPGHRRALERARDGVNV
ncbi:ABC transporter ATP-binding protein [Caballeronia sp. LjRoot31]|jgi:peptide/nickel transport system ATP-binding protein|uniref:ABC transporter ATP-binding protein n=1 Tax=Caballeronia sp. LjRoot31 TaxID=3342324 RepID=UPI003ECED573